MTIGNIVSDAEMRRLYSDSGKLYIHRVLPDKNYYFRCLQAWRLLGRTLRTPGCLLHWTFCRDNVNMLQQLIPHFKCWFKPQTSKLFFLRYYIQIRRIPTFFVWNYIAPSVLINILALWVFSCFKPQFWCQPFSDLYLSFLLRLGRRFSNNTFIFMFRGRNFSKWKYYGQWCMIYNQVTLAISTMLSLTVFLMSVDGGIPETEKIPIISTAIHIQNSDWKPKKWTLSLSGYYFFSLLALTMLATVSAVVVLKIHHRKVIFSNYCKIQIGQCSDLW